MCYFTIFSPNLFSLHLFFLYFFFFFKSILLVIIFFFIYIKAFSIPYLRPCEHGDELKAITLEHCCVTQHSFLSTNGNPFVWCLHLDFLAKCRLNYRINKKGSKYVEQEKDGDVKRK